MAASLKISCDACDADLTYTGNCVDYRLVLGSESKPTYPGASMVTAMGIDPPIDRNYHFCTLSCLDRWRDHERHYNKSMQAYHDEWKKTRGHKDDDGRITSWPSPSEEILKGWRERCRDIAKAQHPLGPETR